MKTLPFVLLMIVALPAWGVDIPDADSPGGKLFATRCSTCHTLPHPKRLDWPHWRHMLGVMKQRINERSVPGPTKEEWQQIAAYLKTHAR